MFGEYGGTSIDCRAGGHDVIDQDHRAACIHLLVVGGTFINADRPSRTLRALIGTVGLD